MTAQIMKAGCPSCGGERNCKDHGSTEKRFDEEGVWGATDYRLLECQGCETVFFQESSWHSEHWDYKDDPTTDSQVMYFPRTFQTFPPMEARKKPEWLSPLWSIDQPLQVIMSQVYSAANAKLNILAAIGLRTAFDRATELLGINPVRSFAQKLNELSLKGWIGDAERKTLEIVTDAGSAAAHRAWSPSTLQLDLLITTMELFLHRAIVAGDRTSTVKAFIPKRTKSLAPSSTPLAPDPAQ